MCNRQWFCKAKCLLTADGRPLPGQAAVLPTRRPPSRLFSGAKHFHACPWRQKLRQNFGASRSFMGRRHPHFSTSEYWGLNVRKGPAGLGGLRGECLKRQNTRAEPSLSYAAQAFGRARPALNKCAIINTCRIGAAALPAAPVSRLTNAGQKRSMSSADVV